MPAQGAGRPGLTPRAERARQLAAASGPGVGEVPPGRDYVGVLRGGRPGAGLLGALLAVLAFFTFTPLLTQALVAGYWLVTGRRGDFTATYAALLRYEHPWGMVSAQLGIALLIPICVVLMRWFHRVRPGYLFSVAPGLRWRALAAFLALAVVSLNAVLWALNAALGRPFVWQPQPGLAGYLAAILITCPLQAAAEEVLFRGYLLQTLGSVSPRRWFGILASALVFALFHGAQNPWLFGSRFAFGVLAAVLVVYVGGLEAGIAAHVVNNVFAFVYAGLSTGIPAVKAIREVALVDALGEIAMYAVFTGLALLLARRLRLRTTTPDPSGLASASKVR